MRTNIEKRQEIIVEVAVGLESVVNDMIRLKNAYDDKYGADTPEFVLAAGQCIIEKGLLGDYHGHQYCSVLHDLEKLSKGLEECGQLGPMNAVNAILRKYKHKGVRMNTDTGTWDNTDGFPENKEISDHNLAYSCDECGSVKFNLLKSGLVECAQCTWRFGS